MNYSVALCTYNGAAYIREQLESIVSNGVRPQQIVVCDDRSSDDTAIIIDEYASRCPIAIELHINDKNLGYVRNFEKAIGLCVAPIVFLSDQDDIWETDKAELILARFSHPSVGGVFSDAALAYADLAPMGITMFSRLLSRRHRKQLVTANADDMFRFLLARPIVTGATLAFRRSLYNALLPFPETRFFIHDGWLALGIAAMSTLSIIDQPLITYRQHSAQQVGLPKDGISEHDDRPKYPVLRRGYATMYDEIYQNLFTRPEVRVGARRILSEAIAHNNRRLSLKEHSILRPFLIVWDVLNFRYSKYSSGLFSAAIDFIRPQSW